MAQFVDRPLARSFGANLPAGPLYIADRPYPTYTEIVLADLDRVAKIANGGSIAGLTDVTVNGINMVQLAIPNADTVLAPIALSSPVDMSGGGSIVVYVQPVTKMDGASSALQRFTLEAVSTTLNEGTNYSRSDNNVSGSDFRLRSSAADAATAGRLQQYSVATQQFGLVGTGANMAAVTALRIRLRCTAADAVVRIQKIAWRPNPRTKAALVLGCDDGFAIQKSYCAPAAEAVGARLTIYAGAYNAVIGTAGRMTWPDLKDLHNGGHQVAGQAYDSEDVSGHDAAWLASQLTSMKADIRNLAAAQDDGYDGSYFSLFTDRNQTLYPTMAAAQRTVRAAYLGNSATPVMVHGETFPIGDAKSNRAINISNGAWGANTGARLIELLDQAIANRGVLEIFGHDEWSRANQSAIYAADGWDALVAYAAARPSQVEFVTKSKLLFG